MKILVFTDPHGSSSAFEKVEKLAKKEKADLILCPGDLTIFEEGLEHWMKKIDKWGLPILLIHGNHEQKSILEYLANKSKNIKFVHKQSYRVGNVLILCFGGEGFGHYHEQFDKIAEDWKDEIKKEDTVILMTHQPPFKIIDEVMGEHTGSKSIAAFIKKVKPKFCFCGHLHEHFDEEEMLKKTRVINTGPYGHVYEV